MEKPDFNLIARDYINSSQSLSDWVEDGGMKQNRFISDVNKYRRGCEHVWNTHVLPLQEKLAGIDAFVDTCADEYKREYSKLESDNKLLREEIGEWKSMGLEAANEISRLKKEIERLKLDV